MAPTLVPFTTTIHPFEVSTFRDTRDLPVSVFNKMGRLLSSCDVVSCNGKSRLSKTIHQEKSGRVQTCQHTNNLPFNQIHFRSVLTGTEARGEIGSSSSSRGAFCFRSSHMMLSRSCMTNDEMLATLLTLGKLILYQCKSAGLTISPGDEESEKGESWAPLASGDHISALSIWDSTSCASCQSWSSPTLVAKESCRIM